MLVAVRVKDDWLALMPERLQLGHKTRIERVLDASRDERKQRSVGTSWSLYRVQPRKQHVPRNLPRLLQPLPSMETTKKVLKTPGPSHRKHAFI